VASLVRDKPCYFLRNLPNLTLKALQEASTRGIRISGDLNYRSNLWQLGKKPRPGDARIDGAHFQVMIAGKTVHFSACLILNLKILTMQKAICLLIFPT